MPKSLQGLHAASATAVLPTGSTTGQGLAFTHDTCSRHITRVQRGIFYLPFPFNGHAAQHTVFVVQNTWETTTLIWHPATPPPIHTRPPRCCSNASVDKRAGHPVAMGGYVPPSHTQTKQPTAHFWEHYQTASPRAGPDRAKAIKPSPSHQAGLQMTCHPKKGKAGKKSVSKTI